MDALDRLSGPAADLLARVDDTLARSGAPDDHPIWPLLRQVRALPGDAVAAIAALEPAPLGHAAAVLRRTIGGYEAVRDSLPDELGWSGAGAESFAAQWAALAAHLGSAPDNGLAGGLAATLSYVDAIEVWIRAGRAAVARTLAEVLICLEAVEVRTGAEGAARGAADIGARVLAAVAEVCERGERVLDEWRAPLAELVYVPPAPVRARHGGDGTTVVPT
jgi:hypothetical protein